MPSPQFHEPVDFVKKLRDLLDFVEDDPGAFGPVAAQTLQTSRIAGKLKVERRVQKVEEEGIGEDVPEPGAFAGSARPKKKERSSW